MCNFFCVFIVCRRSRKCSMRWVLSAASGRLRSRIVTPLFPFLSSLMVPCNLHVTVCLYFNKKIDKYHHHVHLMYY